MEENEVQTNETVETSASASTERTNVGQQFDQIQDDINTIKDEKEKSMDDVLDTAKDKVKEAEDKVLEDFLATLDPKVDSYDDLTEEQKEEYEKYKEAHLPAMIEEVYANAKNKVFEVSKDRMEALNGKEKEAKELEGTLAGEIETRRNELAGLDPEKDKDRIAQLESEIAEIEEIQGSFDEKIYGTINKAKDYQKVINNNAIESLSETFKPYPQINVQGDPDLAKINKEIGQKEEQEKTADEEEPTQDEQEKTEEEKAKDEKQGQAKVGQQIDPAALANAVKAAPSAGGAAVPVAEEVKEVEQEAPSLSSMLGIDPNNALGFESSWSLLAKFTSQEINDAQRLQMLNDPECKKYIMNAMKIAGAEKNPFKTRQYRGIRDQVLELAKGPMMEMALREYGIDNPDNISKSFEELKAKYVEERAAIDDDDKQAIDELNEKYDTMFNVEDFQMDSKKLKTIRTRFKDFVGIFTNEDKRKLLAEKAESVMFKPAEPTKGDEPEVAEPEERGIPSLKGQVKSEEERTNIDVQTEEKATKEVEINKADLERHGDEINKKDPKKDEDDLIL